ncbi:UNVERIFIED_CONTAM: hypothetical protein FKN15_062711 [Acipenser sinensis]
MVARDECLCDIGTESQGIGTLGTDSFIIPIAPASHVPKEIKLENEEEPADEALLSISSVTSSPPRKRMHLEIKPEPHKKKIQIALPRKQSNPTAPSSEIRNENSVSLMKPSAVLQRNSMLIACFDEISNENSEHMLAFNEDYDGYSEQLLYSSDACNGSSVHTPGNNDILNGSSVHTPGNNDILNGSSVHTPGNNDILNGSSVHTPGNNDILNGSSVHTPGNNDILNGSSVHTPCSNDTVIENSTYMNQHSQLDDSDGLSMIQISNVTSLVMSQADFFQTPGKYGCGVCGQEHRLYSSLLKHKRVHSETQSVIKVSALQVYKVYSIKEQYYTE